MSRWIFRGLTGEGDWGPPPDAIPGTPGDDDFRGVRGVFDMSQGGDDILRFKGSDDTAYFGAAFTGADRVSGGKGVDTVILEGDYSAGVEIQTESLIKVEKLVLEGGSYLLTGSLNFLGGPGYMVDAHTLDASQSLNLDVASRGGLTVLAGAGDDVLHASESGTFSQLVGADGDDTLVGGSGASKLIGAAGADRIVMSGSDDIAAYGALDSVAKEHDTIEGFAASGGRIELVLDSDTSTPGFEFDFHTGKTTERAGDILFKYDARNDETIVKVFTDHDKTADLIVHLTGDVPLTTADFIFG